MTGTARIATQIAEINARLQQIEAQNMKIAKQLLADRADVEDNLERALAKVIDARLEVIQRRSASLQATLSTTLQRPMQECQDDVVRNVVGPLVSAAVQNEMNVSIYRSTTYTPQCPFDTAVTPGRAENDKSMGRAFVSRLKPSAAKGKSKDALHVPGLPSIVVASVGPSRSRYFKSARMADCYGLVTRLHGRLKSNVGGCYLVRALRPLDCNDFRRRQ